MKKNFLMPVLTILLAAVVLFAASAGLSTVREENARKELGQIRQNTFDYLDNVMAEVDRCLSGMVGEVRMERGELNNHR